MEPIEISLIIIKSFYPILLLGVLTAVIWNKNNLVFEVKINIVFVFIIVTSFFALCLMHSDLRRWGVRVNAMLHTTFFILSIAFFWMCYWQPNKAITNSLTDKKFLSFYINKNCEKKELPLGKITIGLIVFFLILSIVAWILSMFIDRNLVITYISLLWLISIISTLFIITLMSIFGFKLIILNHLWNNLEQIPENKEYFILINKRMQMSDLKKYRDTKNRIKRVNINELCSRLDIQEYKKERLTFKEAIKYLFLGEKSLTQDEEV